MDIGNYKPEELQTRYGFDVVGIYKNHYNLVTEYYTVVYLNAIGIHKCVQVAKNGKRHIDESDTSDADIIVKPKTINLKDYINQPELLQLRDGSEIEKIYPYTYPDSYFVTYKVGDEKYSYVVHDSTGLKFNNGETHDEDVILKSQDKPVTSPNEEVNELNECWKLFKRYCQINNYSKLVLFDDGSGQILDHQNIEDFGFNDFSELIEILKKELKEV